MKKINIPVILGAMLLAGCVGPDGRVYPPDPIGHAIFSGIYSTSTPVVYQQPVETVYQPREYVVTSEMPPVQYEQQLPYPGYANAAWIPGYWGWGGNNWGWRRGCWTRRPYNNSAWVGPRYYNRGGNRYWRNGYWRR
ncbi:MAG: hypothetical protein ABI254_01480 [Chthoniobacterales bacterium]